MLAIGLMSGTSLDGIDAALIETDGESLARPIAFRTEPYSDQSRTVLKDAMRLALAFEAPRPNPEIEAAEALLTRSHILAVRKLLVDANLGPHDIGVIGFHGQTVAHRPDRGWTWQIGDGPGMAQALGITVVNDLRTADVAAGGQGAPLLPVYHRALVADLEKPTAVLNLGGVGNISWFGPDGEMIAFDTGPGNALIDDWIETQTGARFDENGALAASGRVVEPVLAEMLDNPFFFRSPPKSLDRYDFTLDAVKELSTADGATTLTAFTAISVAKALKLCPEPPRRLIVAGGGRHNGTLMRMLGAACGVDAELIEALGWNGDSVEAEGFAYMAARTLKGLPISFPGTTGVPADMPGGTIHTV